MQKKKEIHDHQEFCLGKLQMCTQRISGNTQYLFCDVALQSPLQLGHLEVGKADNQEQAQEIV